MAVKMGSKGKPSAVVAPSGEAGAATRAPVEKVAAAPHSEAVNVDDFGRLVAGMSRLLAGFGQLKPFRDGGLGLGEWVALGIFAQRGGMTNKLMGRTLGVPLPRVAQITASLAQGGLVASAQPAEGGKGGKVIKITDAGKIKLEAINSELTAVLKAGLNGRSLGAGLKQMRLLGRVLRTGTSEKANRKKMKQAKGASEASAVPAQA